MKLRTTEIEIEATADELKASNGLADALSNQLRNVFNSLSYANFADDDEEVEQE